MSQIHYQSLPLPAVVSLADVIGIAKPVPKGLEWTETLHVKPGVRTPRVGETIQVHDADEAVRESMRLHYEKSGVMISPIISRYESPKNLEKKPRILFLRSSGSELSYVAVDSFEAVSKKKEVLDLLSAGR